MAWVVTTSTSFANLSCNHAKWESSGEFSNGLYQDRKHFCIFCAALNVTVEHNATGQGIDEANSPKNLANASTTVGSLSWHLIHESMSSVHLASSCYLYNCLMISYISGDIPRHAACGTTGSRFARNHFGESKCGFTATQMTIERMTENTIPVLPLPWVPRAILHLFDLLKSA